MRRSRRLSPDELAPYLLETPEPPAPFPWPAVFGNSNPVELEVGCGKGLFLLTAAETCPQVNFLGIEIVRKYQLFTATRLAKRALTNVRVARADGRLFLRGRVASGSVQAVHVYFPDPWWKKRHHKRRVFTPGFAVEIERVVRPGGRLYVATDVEAYFGVITELVRENTRLRPIPPPTPRNPTHDLDYLTNFERKFRKEGRPIYWAVWERETVEA